MKFVFFGTDVEDQAVFYEEEAKKRFEEAGIACEVSRGSAGVTVQLESCAENAEAVEAIFSPLFGEACEKFPQRSRERRLAAILAATSLSREDAPAVISAGPPAFPAEEFDKMFRKCDFVPKKEQSMGDFVRSLGKSKRR